jgi:hypothetical protein
VPCERREAGKSSWQAETWCWRRDGAKRKLTDGTVCIFAEGIYTDEEQPIEDMRAEGTLVLVREGASIVKTCQGQFYRKGAESCGLEIIARESHG